MCGTVQPDACLKVANDMDRLQMNGVSYTGQGGTPGIFNLTVLNRETVQLTEEADRRMLGENCVAVKKENIRLNSGTVNVRQY